MWLQKLVLIFLMLLQYEQKFFPLICLAALVFQ